MSWYRRAFGRSGEVTTHGRAPHDLKEVQPSREPRRAFGRGGEGLLTSLRSGLLLTEYNHCRRPGDRYDCLAMRRMLVAGTLALAVVVAACGGNDDPSGIDGLLWVVGGRYPGLDQPTAGKVSVYPATAEGEGTLLSQPVGVEPIAELAVGSTGEFRISLPPGTYLLAAQMVGGYAWWTQWVEVNPGGYTPITITCYIR